MCKLETVICIVHVGVPENLLRMFTYNIREKLNYVALFAKASLGEFISRAGRHVFVSFYIFE